MANTSHRFTRRLQRHLRAALDTYSIRFSIGLVASLLLVIGFTRLPLHDPTPRVGWDLVSGNEGIQLSDFRLATDDASPPEPETPASEAPITVQGEQSNPTPDEAPSSPDEEPPATAAAPDTGDTGSSLRRDAVQLAALGPFGREPRLAGGRGSFYLRIAYPEEARRQGIEGRVVLDFVVDTDGATRDIRVIQSLHPLCDSSAVAALEETQFVPGRREGKKVPVRMRLPVRFQIVNYTMNSADAAPQKPPPNPF